MHSREVAQHVKHNPDPKQHVDVEDHLLDTTLPLYSCATTTALSLQLDWPISEIKISEVVFRLWFELAWDGPLTLLCQSWYICPFSFVIMTTDDECMTMGNWISMNMSVMSMSSSMAISLKY